MPCAGTPEPSAEEVRTCLARVLASEEFRNSPNLAAFLGFIVERTLQGRPDTIKAYSVATEVLGRPPSFDPQADPIVRVEATRLRRSLERYYARGGASDAVVITIPKGSYVPVIGWREAQAAPDRDEPIEPTVAPAMPRPGRPGTADRGAWRLGAGIATCVAVAAAAATGSIVLRTDTVGAFQEAPLPLALAARDIAPVKMRGGLALTTLATIVVPPVAEGSPGAQGQAMVLTDLLRTGLARFEDVVVVEAAAEQPGGAGAAEDSYALLGRVTRQGAGAQLVLRLRHELSRQVVWSSQFDLADPRLSGAGGLGLMREVAAALVSETGVIAGDPGSAKLRADPMLVPVACIRDASRALTGLDAGEQAAARACLQQALGSSPRYAPAHAFLARLDLEAWRSGNAADPQLLDRALERARTAVLLAPQGARNHVALAEVLAARGDRAGAEQAAARAAGLNPYSADAAAAVAFRSIEAGRVEEGRTALADTARLPAPGVPWLDLYAALARGDGRPAVPPRPLWPDGTGHPAALLADLIAGAVTGEAAGVHAAELRRRLPAASADPAGFLRRFALPEELVQAGAAAIVAAQASEPRG